MNTVTLLVPVVLLAGAWNVVASLMIYEALRKRGRNPSFLLLRLLIPVYAGEYRTITIAETGKTGPLFHHWVVSINTALLAYIIMVLTHVF